MSTEVRSCGDVHMMRDECMPCSCPMILKWACLVLLCQSLLLYRVSGLLSTTSRQPTSTSLRKIHAGRAGGKGRAATLMLHGVRAVSSALHQHHHDPCRHNIMGTMQRLRISEQASRMACTADLT